MFIEQILPHLQSRSHDTRSAAALAISHISRAVGIWDPATTAPNQSDSNTSPTSAPPSGLQLAGFSLPNLLSSGQLLLSSSGQEYAKLSHLSAEELASAQKDALSKLGLGMGDELGVDVGAELADGAGAVGVVGAVGAKVEAEVKGPAVKAEDELTPVERPMLPPPKFAPGGGALSHLPPPKFTPGGGSLSPAGPDTPPISATASATATASPTPPVDPTPPPAIPSPAILPPPSPLASPSLTSATDDDPYAGLSARERNKLKRKRKSEVKGGAAVGPLSMAAPPAKVRIIDTPPNGPGTATPPLSSVKEEGVTGETVVIDPGAKARAREAAAREAGGGAVEADPHAAEREAMEVKVGEWPWRGTIERLAVGLLAANWETRHGAALGLREILRLQGGGGGQFVGLPLSTNATAHCYWSEDLATKLLCVFALDRFGDYISDQVVAPVRETAAQALATLLPFMPKESVLAVQSILVAMIDQDGAPPSKGLDDKYSGAVAAAQGNDRTAYVWQVRHSGLLGLKYLVAVKGDLYRSAATQSLMEDVLMKAEEDIKPVIKKEETSPQTPGMLKAVVDAALLGLKDGDDDVRSAAAATLSPIADALVEQLPAELEDVVRVLWQCLGDLKDDLSSSVGGVMDLLAKLLAFPSVLALMQSSAFGHSLDELVPRLFPFFRHTIHTVRLAVLNTVLVFLHLDGTNREWVDSRLLRLLFQNLIVEERAPIRDATATAWEVCLNLAAGSAERLFGEAQPYLAGWFALASTQIGTSLAVANFWSAKMSLSGQDGFVHNVDKAMISQDLSLVTVEAVVRGRVAGAVALGKLIGRWPVVAHDTTFGPLLEPLLGSPSAFKRFLGATVIEEWAVAVAAAQGVTSRLPKSSTLASRLVPTLHVLLAAEAPASYSEMTQIQERVKADCVALYGAFASQGKIPADQMPSIPPAFSITTAHNVVTSFDALAGLIPKPAKAKALPALTERRNKLLGAIGYYDATKAKHDRQVYAALGGAVVALGAIPTKITPVIRSITASIKTEDNRELQARAAGSIAALIDLCSSPASPVRVNPSDKLVKNLCTFLCQDISRTPIFGASKAQEGILTLVHKPARGLAAKEAKEAAAETDEVVAARLVSRGAQLALTELATRFGPALLDRVPKLWSCMADALLAVFGSGDLAQADNTLAINDQAGQDLLDCLTVLPTAALRFCPELQPKLHELLPALALASRSKFAVVRYSVARSLAALCDIVPTEGLRCVVEHVIPVLADPVNLDNRRGAVELISHIVELLDIKILPYVIFLVVPVLGRMSDPDDEVRLMATNTFASLVKLVPLEAGLPDPPGFSRDLLAKRQTEREFLMQLLDGSKVQEYKIPISFGVDLRKYQRDGVSWLAFLARYQLHGLLCDDMGLGKTAQSICILASMHHERAERFAATGSPDAVHLPSLIVCPPTLTGHWNQEIKTYAKSVRPLLYTGSKADREHLVPKFGDYDAVITTYDIVRNDAELLGAREWHYCILDEGHVIKNGKTKLTKAVKTIRAIHRLILSGTPIQNNVLELWSLFDFLMPGFLGSEKAFNDRFGKPIAASRDAKASSKEQEAGALALEALHKQVLPFLLRRLKEDVLEDLPPKIIQDYYVELSPLQKQLYDDFGGSQVGAEVKTEVKGGGEGGKPQHVFQALQYLRKLVNHPALVLKPDEKEGHREIVAKLEAGGGKLRDVDNAPKLGALR